MNLDHEKPDAASSGYALEHAEQTPVLTVGTGITRQMLSHGPDLMLCRVSFASGAAGDLHSHPHSQATYVESGRFRVQIADSSTELVAGDSCYVGPNLQHASECIEAGVLIDAFTPAREDFLSAEDSP